MAARIVLIGLLALILAAADTLTLRDGTVLEGKFFGGSSQEVRFVVGKELRFFSLNEVAQITVGAPLASLGQTESKCSETSVPACPSTSQQAAPPEPVGPQTEPVQPQAEPVRAQAEPVRPQTEPSVADSGEIPQGTSLVVRMIDEVDSTRDPAGQSYRARLDNSVVVDGQTMLAKGLEVLARVTRRGQGDSRGPSVYGLELVSITIDDQQVEIKTSQAELPNSGNRKRAKLGGLTKAAARLGRVLGGVNGGQTGGTAEEVGDAAEDVAAGGSDVRVAADARLVFMLIGTLKISSAT